VEVDFPKAHLRGSAQVRVAGPRGASERNVAQNNFIPYTLPAYALFDVALMTSQLRLFGPKSDTRILVSGRNLIDQRFSEPGFGGFDTPALGRSFWFEVRQVFQ